jgi:hypothetical protein
MGTMGATASRAIDRLRAKRRRILHELMTINRKFEALAGPILTSRPAKFQFYERVVVLQDAPEIFGKTGSILGRAQSEDGTWVYAVLVIAPDEAWDIAESDLESTGIVDKREDFYRGKSVRVRVSNAGRGSVSTHHFRGGLWLRAAQGAV